MKRRTNENMNGSIIISIMRASLALCAALCIIGLAACSGNGASAVFNQGNWAVMGNSSVSPGQTIDLGGSLTQSGEALTMALNSNATQLCFIVPGPFLFSGTLVGNSATLTSSSVNGVVITLQVNGTNPNSFTGSYAIAGGPCDGDKGSSTGTFVPPITGTWSGKTTDNSNITLTVSITQAQTAATDGSFKLTLSNLVVTGPTCYTAATTGQGYVRGDHAVLDFDVHNSDGTVGVGGFSGTITDPATPNTMSGNYLLSSAPCGGIQVIPMTLTKQ